MAAIVIGLGAGAATTVVERWGLLRGQERVRATAVIPAEEVQRRGAAPVPGAPAGGRTVLVLGGNSFWSVPLAATLGIPVYLSSDGSLPLVATLLQGGMGTGAALAFLTTGAGTSIGAISGMLVIARWRVVALVVACLWLGAVVLGLVAPWWL